MSDLLTCVCGRITDGVQTTCWPCASGNVRGGFYGPRGVESWQQRAADLLAQNDALVAQLATLSTQYAALVRAGKRGGAEG